MTTTPLSAPPPLVIEPKSEAKSAVIWLHGLGADAHDFEGIVPYLPTEACGIRMILPNAPKRKITINMGMSMPAWYDIRDLSLRHADQQGIANSNDTIQQLINDQIASGINSKKIVLAGFSQGGAMAIHAGLRCQHQLAGIIALSCYVLDRDNHDAQAHAANRTTPVWMAHGKNDAVVPYELGNSSADFLRQHSYDVDFQSYAMGHEVCMPEIDAISRWLTQQLN